MPSARAGAYPGARTSIVYGPPGGTFSSAKRPSASVANRNRWPVVALVTTTLATTASPALSALRVVPSTAAPLVPWDLREPGTRNRIATTMTRRTARRTGFSTVPGIGRLGCGCQVCACPSRCATCCLSRHDGEVVFGGSGSRDQLLQLFQQLHHRPRIPLTIVEQIFPHPVVLVARDLPGHEEQPSDLHARHAAIHDHEVIVGQLRDERREDLLETVAAVEAGMIDAVPHHRMEIEQLRLERGELGGQLRDGLLHFSNAGLFEGRVHDD